MLLYCPTNTLAMLLYCPTSTLAILLLPACLLLLAGGAAGCPDPHSHFHGLMEEAWREEPRMTPAMEAGMTADMEPGMALPRERMSRLRKYCNCKGQDQPSDFCRLVYVSYHSTHKTSLQKEKPGSALKEKKYLKGSQVAVHLEPVALTDLSIFVTAVASQLLVQYVVVVLAREEATAWSLPGLFKASLASHLSLTVMEVRPGTNLSQAVMAGSTSTTAVFLLGRRSGSIVKEVSQRGSSPCRPCL